jgi:tetrathionate reductase subunit B
MARYAMVTDLRRCVACHACTVACNGEWDVPPGHARTHVRPTPISGTFPKLVSSMYVAQCNHCDRPSCVPACPSGATYQSADGVVQVNKDVCIGCGFCVEACPYTARYMNPVTGKVDKCDFCSSRTARGLEPACVKTCTAHAKTFGDLEDPASDVYRMVYHQEARSLQTPTVAISPRVYYAGKPEHLDLVLASFPPHPPRLLAAGEAWQRLLKPLVVVAVGATFLGQAAAFFTQLWKGEEDHEH